MFTLFLVLHYAAGSLQGNNKKMHYLCGQLLSVLPMHMKIYAELGRRAPACLFPTTCANTRANFRRKGDAERPCRLAGVYEKPTGSRESCPYFVK